MGYIVFDQFQTSKPFRGAGFIIICLTYHSECLLGCKRYSKYERKNGMLKIENCKNKSNMKIIKKMTKINNAKGGRTKKKKVKTC